MDVPITGWCNSGVCPNEYVIYKNNKCDNHRSTDPFIYAGAPLLISSSSSPAKPFHLV
jgi:hypothetical protein